MWSSACSKAHTLPRGIVTERGVETLGTFLMGREASPFRLHPQDWPSDTQAAHLPPQCPHCVPHTGYAMLFPHQLCMGGWSPSFFQERTSLPRPHGPQKWSWTQNPLPLDPKACASKCLTQWPLSAQALEQAPRELSIKAKGSGLQPRRATPGTTGRAGENSRNST